jgi:hypothetical protein
MNPNDNQSIPADYLNQIAVKPTKKESFLNKRPILIGGIAIVVIILILMVIGSLSSGTKPSEQLAARLLATQNVANDATSKIKSPELRALNSNLKIYLTNAIRDIAAPLSKEKLNINKLDKKVVLAESDTKMLATLEDARLNAIYDRIYAREMAYQLDTVLTLMRQIDNDTGNKDLKSFLDSKIENLVPIQKQFADFNAATS